MVKYFKKQPKITPLKSISLILFLAIYGLGLSFIINTIEAEGACSSTLNCSGTELTNLTLGSLRVYGTGAANYFTVEATETTVPNTYSEMRLKSGSRSGYLWIMNEGSSIYGGDGALNIYSESGPLLLWTAGTEKMRITTDGKVGIGTGVPTGKLHVRDLSGDLHTYLESADTGNIYFLFQDVAAGRGGIISGTGNDLQFRTGGYAPGNEAMRINSLGNVGIGTANPTRKLDVASDVAHSASGLTSQISVYGTADNTQKLNIGYDTTSHYGFIEAVDESQNWQNLSLQSYGGNVGIGDTNPGTKLVVSTGANGDIVNLQGSGYSGTFGLDATGFYIYNNTSLRNISLGTNSSKTQLVLSGNGNVGIGTANPVYKLDVNGVGRFSDSGGNDVKLVHYELGPPDNYFGLKIYNPRSSPSGENNTYGIYSEATGGSGLGTGNNFGVLGKAKDAGPDNTNYGVYGWATGSGSINIGLAAFASGATSNYAIYTWSGQQCSDGSYGNCSLNDIAEEWQSEKSLAVWKCKEGIDSPGECSLPSDFKKEFFNGDVVCAKEGATNILKKCEEPYDKTAIASISEDPTVVLGGAGPYNVALAGNIPVKVICDNPIEVGDLLVYSGIENYAMKLAVDPNDSVLDYHNKSQGVFAKALEACESGRKTIRAWK
ncbi:MAG: hypothetical protein ABIE43_04595 [Patescibacteria group bacterium]